MLAPLGEGTAVDDFMDTVESKPGLDVVTVAAKKQLLQ